MFIFSICLVWVSVLVFDFKESMLLMFAQVQSMPCFNFDMQVSHVCMCTFVKRVMCVVGSGLGMSQSSRLSSSVSAMRVLNTGSDVEEALADALVNKHTGTHKN